VLGCVVGAAGLALTQVFADFNTVIDEEASFDEGSGGETAAA